MVVVCVVEFFGFGDDWGGDWVWLLNGIGCVIFGIWFC